MLITEQHTKILIVGAGPSGLMMAAQLLRHGVQPIIIDSKKGPTDHSKALAVQARSLEIYRQLGIINRVIEGGKKAESVRFYQDREMKTQLSLSNTGERLTKFPFIQLYPQSKNERLLLEYLTNNCCPVYWDTSLLSLNQKGKLVEIKLQSGADTINLTCNWLIGADGAHSTVRKQLGIPFKGDTYPNEFFLADAELANTQLAKDSVDLIMSKNGFVGYFPMPEANYYRVIGNLPQALQQKKNITLDETLAHINLLSGFNLNVIANKWFTNYRLHHRMAEQFRKQNTFLIGDAAHIHSPVGGQGMNTGLQDAYNLGWKLAGVVNNHLNDKILDSYAAERMPIAKDLLNTTDRVFKVILSTNWLTMAFKKWVLPQILQFVWRNDNRRDLFFKRVSQIFINYRQSNINLHLSNSTKIKAGDRLPYLKVFDEKKQVETDLHAWCAKPGFTLIVMGKVQEFDLFALAKWITQNYNPVLNFFYLPPSAKNIDVFNAFEVGKNKARALIIRPDMHIGLINDALDIELMDNYLLNIVGVTKTSPAL